MKHLKKRKSSFILSCLCVLIETSKIYKILYKSILFLGLVIEKKNDHWHPHIQETLSHETSTKEHMFAHSFLFVCLLIETFKIYELIDKSELFFCIVIEKYKKY